MKYLFLLTLTTLFYASCIKSNCTGVQEDYFFQAPITVTPYKDTLKVGDTLHIVSEFSHNVLDMTTNDIYTLKNYAFYPSLIFDIINHNPIRAGLSATNVIEDGFKYQIINHSDGGSSLQFDYTYDGAMYKFRIKFVLQKTGIYLLRGASATGNLAHHQKFDGRCSDRSQEVVMPINKQAKSNLHLLYQSSYPSFHHFTLQEHEKYGGYCFVVVP